MFRKALVVAAGTVAFLLGSPQLVASELQTDPILTGFLKPPQSARPRVWWHWMNGNITEDGIAKDLAWMRRVGIGGMQNFDASLFTPQVVDDRLVYMSPEWKRAFRFTAERAKEEGLELGIAGSPGWSETGGPWVPLKDGIKKVVWSETFVAGGHRLDEPLVAPPAVTGPFQSLPAGGVLGLAREGELPPEYYSDIAILAVPDAEAGELGDVVFSDGKGRELDGALLTDGNLLDVVELGVGTPDKPVMLTATYAQPHLIRSATLFTVDESPSFADVYFTPVLEARIEGVWRYVASFDIAAVPTTVAFAPIRTSELRVVFAPYTGPQRPAQVAKAPGAVVPRFISTVAGTKSVKVAEFRLSGQRKVDRFETKAGFDLVNDYFALATTASVDEQGADIDRVIDLTDRMSPDGLLDWTAPQGRWRVIRLGWSLTGKTNHPATPEATGLEVDKLDGGAVERYLRHYLDMYRETVGQDLFGTNGVQVLLTDSTEVGAFNWTPRFVEKFGELRGYDPTPWLPTIAGVVIGTRGESDRFLYDFRRTLSELHASEHYATVARVAREYGLTVYGEALEDQRPVLGDDLALRRYADVPMAALWTWSDENGPRPTLLGDMKGASSVAHLYGQNVVAAESMTSALSPWADAPSDLRKVVDLEFAHGINRPVIHTSVHQPLDDMQPGLSLMIFGQFFNRHETWAELARPWVDYMSRTAFLLQQGRNVADVAYFYGEEAPVTAITAFGPPGDLPVRYAYDYVNADALKEVISVDSGDLVAPSGARYRVLYLGPGASRMTLPTLRRIAELVADGATVVGHAPTSSPSLADDPEEFASLVGQLWRGSGVTPAGKGRVIETRDVEAALVQVGVAPDVQISQAAAATDIMFVHRQLEDGDLYFLVNRGKREQTLDVRFRVFGKAPDIWRADSATITPLSFRQEAAGTATQLVLGAEESIFVAFRRDTNEQELTIATPALVPILEPQGPWRVSFQKNRGAPESVELDELVSLSEHADEGVRYFSGVATYTTDFELLESNLSQGKFWLDLGGVGDIAEVRINGTVAGSAWHAPFRVDVSDALNKGVNTLEVKVANLWVNRFIGDAQPGANKIASTTVPTFEPGAPLRPSGLIGPVRLLAESGGVANE